MLSKVLIVILLHTSHFREGEMNDAVFVNKNFTYSGAVDYCNQTYNGYVSDQSEHSWNNEKCVQKGETIWKQNREISPWISIIGCYRKGTKTPQVTKVIAHNGNPLKMVADCISQCSRKDTVALHNTTCFCVEARQLVNGDFIQRSDSDCNYFWLGGKTTFTGSALYTVYQRVEANKISGKTDNVYLQCMYQNCKNRTTDNLFAADCNIPLRPTLCSGSKHARAQEQWLRGGFNCWRSHSKFMRGFQENNKAPLCRERVEGWIGVFRLFIRSKECSVVLYREQGQIKTIPKYCSERYPFICVLPKDTGNGCIRESTLATPSTTSNLNTGRVNFPTASQVSTNTINEVNTIQTTTMTPPGFEIKYILIAASASVLLFLIVIIAAVLCCRKYKRKNKAELVLLQKQPNKYVGLNADSSGTANTENSVIPPTNSDEISNNNLTRTKTIRNYEGIENKGLNGNGHYVVGRCDITSNAKSNEYDTIKETTEKDNYDTFQPNKDNSVVMPSEYSTAREVTENNEYDTFQKDRNVLSSVDMYDTTKNLNINSEYDMFKNSKENEHQSEHYVTDIYMI